MKQLLMKKSNMIFLAVICAIIVCAVLLLTPGGGAGNPAGLPSATGMETGADAAAVTLNDGETPLSDGSGAANYEYQASASATGGGESGAANGETSGSAVGTGAAAETSAADPYQNAYTQKDSAGGASGGNGGGNSGSGDTSGGSGNGGGASQTGLTATLSIDCLTILNNTDKLDQSKSPFVGNGSIMGARTVAFTEGETVFDVLYRECRASGIHMSSRFTPIYNSAYIEGINQLYEFDCGALSGWMYNVNGWYPNYGCSQYALKDGDVIQWRYTCDLGADIGGSEVVQG